MKTMTKGRFAELVGRSPACVSGWIRDGKLHGNALVGEGRYALVNVDVAIQQLGPALDLGQQLAQPRPIIGGRMGADKPGSDQERLLKARADREELALQKERAEAAEADGRWMLTEAAMVEWSRQLAELVRATETWLVTEAAEECARAAAGGAGPKELGAILRRSYTGLRQRLADVAASGAGKADHEPPDDEDAELEGIAE